MPWCASAFRVWALTPSSANVDKVLLSLCCRCCSRPVEGNEADAVASEEASTGESTLSPVISILGLEKAFGPVHAVRGVDLRVQPGEILVLLGQNGAGKSTTL